MTETQTRSALLSSVPGIAYGFGDRRIPLPANLQRAKEESAVRHKQVHGTRHAEIVSAGQDCGEVDALFSFGPGLPACIVTADCVPILMAHRSGRAVAALHAGWRGTQARISRSLWNTLEARGESPAEWVAAIGPAIGPCCYEVSEELANQFEKKYSSEGVPSFRHLDLPAINARQLAEIGVKQVEILRACTRCTLADGEPLFHSYRREGGGTRQYSGIMRQASPGFQR